MDILNRMRQNMNRFASPNLSLYISIIFAIGFLLLRTDFGISLYSRYLAFYPYEVLHGQIWRILTMIFYPPVNTSSILMGLLSIFIYYNFASAVERTMGDRTFIIYFFGSLLIGELGSIVYYLISGIDYPFIPMYTHFSVFMAFAIIYSEAQVLLFFLIPVKVKYVAIVELLIYLWQLIQGDLQTKISIIAALIPVVIFYFYVDRKRNGDNIIGRWKFSCRQAKRHKEWNEVWK